MISKKLIVIFICSLAMSCAKELVDDGAKKDEPAEIELILSPDHAGALPELIDGKYNKSHIKSLTINGPLNGTDILFIRELAGSDKYGNDVANGNLVRLDIKDARIVDGGEPYFIIKRSKEDSTEFRSRCDEISDYTFYGCRLETVILSESIINIGENAFGDSWLKDINMPAGLKTIQRKAFCNSLLRSNLSFPPGMTEIPDSVCYYCTNLKSITIPPSVKIIGKSSFLNCRNAYFDVFEESLDSVSFASFALCEKLEQTYLSDKSKTISSCAYYGCSSIVNPTLPESVEFIGNNAFYNSGLTGVLNIPKNVKAIYDEAFGLNDGITEVNVNSNIYSDGVAFYSCKHLKKVSVCDGVTVLALSFRNCLSLESVILPESLTTLGCCYKYDDFFEEYRWNSTYIFYNCICLKKLHIPAKVRNIGSYSFASSGLQSISFPEFLIEIPQGTCKDCSELCSVSIPESVTDIGPYAFQGCQSLSDVILPKRLALINASTFKDCESLKSVYLPDQVKEISTNAFYNCQSLESVIFDKGSVLEEIRLGAFTFCKSLRSISLPLTATKIGTGAFFNSGLECIDLPEGLTNISESAFADCNRLTDVTVPASTTLIGSKAFCNCINLINFTNKSTEPQEIDNTVFDGCYLNGVLLLVPESAVNQYKSSPIWSKFGIIVPRLRTTS